MDRFFTGVFYLLNWAFAFGGPLLLLPMLRKFLEPRRGIVWLLCRYFACWLMFNNIIFIGDTVNILAALPVVFLCICLSYRCTASEWLSVSALFFTVTMTLAALTDSGWDLLALFQLGGRAEGIVRFLSRYNYTIRGALLLPTMLLLLRLLPQERYRLSPRMWRLVGLLSLLPFTGIVAMVTLVSPFYDMDLAASIGHGMLPLFLMLPLFFLTALALLYTAAVLSRQEQLEREAALARMNQAYYDQMEQQQPAPRHGQPSHGSLRPAGGGKDRGGHRLSGRP